jgi:hypothetical protein
MRISYSFIVSLASLAFVFPIHSPGQGTLGTLAAFDGPPYIAPGTGIGANYYREEGMTFKPINAGEQFTRAGASRVGFPDNGTAYILQGAFDSLSGVLSYPDRVWPFRLLGVDLAEFSTLYDYPKTVQFLGYKADGSTVVQLFTTDGVIDGTGPVPDFETFTFQEDFTDLVRFEIPDNTYALDNLRFMPIIPEPGTVSLLLFGAGLWRGVRRRLREK